MLSTKSCLRLSQCEPIANIASENTFVCIGMHREIKEGNTDEYRHCFKSETTDTIHDYDIYDIISVINVFSEALLIDHLNK